MEKNIANILSKLKYFVIDIDGTMTDAGIYYDNKGNELKKFSTKDAAGFFAAHAVGIKFIVITGRECQATLRRLQELKADYIFQDIKNKEYFLQEFMKKENIKKSEIGYLGDDLNDLQAMKCVSFIGCPSDACKEIRKMSHYISSVKGGNGAVRDIIEFVLTQRNEWDYAIEKSYSLGI